MMHLLPQPHHMEIQDGQYRLTYQSRITIDAACGEQAYESARILAEDLEQQTGLSLMIDRRMTNFHPGIYLYQREELKNRLGAEAYELTISEEGVTVTGGDAAGLLYGVQTLRQVIRQKGCLLPYLHIEDYPELSVRGWFHDVTRGRIPTMDFLKRMADQCSFYKINQMHLYIEHTFLFDGFSEMWRDDTPLTAADILELDAYCRNLNIDLVPSVATFGHLYKLLRTKTYRHLSELEEADGTAFSFFNRMRHHTLNVTDEESLRLVYRMMDEFLPLFSSKLFNMNGDETFDLGKGKGKPCADQVGSHRMYIDWINKISAHAKELGKRPMFWGDIIAAHPETIKELPEDIICMTWDYGLNPGDTNVRRLWENGAVQYLCPGVQGWNQAINSFDTAYANIKKMAVFAHQFEGAGLLVTDWGDYGHFQYPEFAMPGVAYAAAMGWNSRISEKEDINRDISVLEFGDRSGKLMAFLADLSNQTVMSWGELIECEEEMRYRVAGKGMEAFWKGYLPRIERKLPLIQERNDRMDACCDEIRGLMPDMNPGDRARMLPYFIMSDGQKLLNRMIAVLAKKWLGNTDVPDVEPAGLAADFEIWYMEYKKLWRNVSRESELYRIGEAIFWAADYLRDMDETHGTGESDCLSAR